MSNKIITDDILQKSIQDTIQIIADNIFEFESYSDESIAELFSLTPEESQHISDLIADTVISQYKLWSSKKVSDELLSAKNECNDYTDTRLSNISSISLKYCTALPSVGESNCIYILKSTDSTPDTLNLYDGTWVTIGKFTIKLDDFYKKSEVDTKLDLKADKTEILAQDDVITDTSLATTSNVLSATTTIEELDKKVDKTSMVTSISSTSTDDTVPSAKAVYDNVIKDNNLKSYTTLEQLGLTTPTTVRDIYNALPTNSCLNSFASLTSVIDLPLQQGLLSITKISTSGFDIIFKRSGSSSKTDNTMYIGQLKGADGTRLTWERVCTTSVDDVDVTNIIFDDETNYKPNSATPIRYCIYNGICYVTGGIECISVPTSKNINVTTSIPKAITDQYFRGFNINGNDDSSCMKIYINNSTLNLRYGVNGNSYRFSFSYPIAES